MEGKETLDERKGKAKPNTNHKVFPLCRGETGETVCHRNAYGPVCEMSGEISARSMCSEANQRGFSSPAPAKKAVERPLQQWQDIEEVLAKQL